ncbi:hypothetical protein HUU53_04660 [Candidatus Micrarchaeota archaeon]|nr:hypothetical protein [Candidatus Micrarchaeota archaeon]
MDLASDIKTLEERFAGKDLVGLRQLSSEAAIEAFLKNDSSFVELSVIAYSCSKLLEKQYIVNSPEWNSFKESLLRLLAQSRVSFNEGNFERGKALLHNSMMLVESLSTSIGRFVNSLISKARLKIGADMYARGASLGVAASFSGSDKKDLNEYIGSTKMLDKYVTLSVKQRLQNAKEAV